MADPIPDDLLDTMNRVARVLDEGFKPNGFCLLVFPMNTHGGRTSYISNANREDMISALKEFIARCEGRVQETPGHG